MFRKSSLGLKREGTPPHNKCEHASIDLYGGIHLRRKLHRHLWEGAWISQVWRKKQDNWPKVNKDLEGLSHISDLNTSRLCSSSLTLHSSAGVYLCPPSELDEQTVFLCALPIRCAMYLIINVGPVFIVFASLKQSCLQTGARAQATFASRL